MNAVIKKTLSVLLTVFMLVAFIPCINGGAYAASKPGKVKGLKVAADSAASITIKWSKVKGAKKYEVYAKIAKEKKFKKIATTKSPKVIYKGKYSTKYTFKVRAVKGKKKGKYSAEKVITTKAKPQKTNPSPGGKDQGDPAKEEAANQAAADAVIESIQNLPEIKNNMSDEDFAKVKEMIKAYDALTDNQKALLTDEQKAAAEEARTKIGAVEKIREDAAAVVSQVNSIDVGSEETVNVDGIEFFVVKKEGSKALLFAKYKLEEDIPFYDSEVTSGESFGWDTSDLRQKLNNSFLASTPTIEFLAEEVGLTSITEEMVGEEVKSIRTITTNDKVFVLSQEEILGVKELNENLITTMHEKGKYNFLTRDCFYSLSEEGNVFEAHELGYSVKKEDPLTIVKLEMDSYLGFCWMIRPAFWISL